MDMVAGLITEVAATIAGDADQLSDDGAEGILAESRLASMADRVPPLAPTAVPSAVPEATVVRSVPPLLTTATPWSEALVMTAAFEATGMLGGEIRLREAFGGAGSNTMREPTRGLCRGGSESDRDLGGCDCNGGFDCSK